MSNGIAIAVIPSLEIFNSPGFVVNTVLIIAVYLSGHISFNFNNPAHSAVGAFILTIFTLSGGTIALFGSRAFHIIDALTCSILAGLTYLSKESTDLGIKYSVFPSRIDCSTELEILR